MSNDSQQAMMRFQVLEMNLSVVRKKYEDVMRRLEDLEVARATMEELKHVKPSSAMIPIGANNYIEGKIENAEKVIVWIGGGVAAKKSRDEAIRITSDRMKELDGIINELAREEQGIIRELQRLQPEIEKITQGK